MRFFFKIKSFITRKRKPGSKIFALLSIILFFLIPILSIDAGISGDEPVHYKHAEYVYNYYSSLGKDTTALHTPRTYLKYYGQSADNISYILVKWLGISDPYKFRHFLNSIIGWLTILFAGLFARKLGGYSAGILTMIFLFLSPVFLGHSFNNLKDIPFAFTYIFSLYYMLKFLSKIPKPDIKTSLLLALGIGMSISIRAGGILLIIFLLMYSALQYLLITPIKTIRNKNNISSVFRLLGFLFLISVIAYFLGLLLWPYGLIDPLNNPFISLAELTDYKINLRQLFNGKLIWSQDVPWYYIPKYFIISNPIIILAGGIICALLSKHFIRKSSIPYIILVFSLVFPLFYIIIKQSNLYGGSRHLLFIYPLFVVLSASGIIYLIKVLKSDLFKALIVMVVLIGLFFPARHIINNHPYEYIYYNQLAGGVNKAFAKYETDYYYHSMAEATDWLKDHIKQNFPENSEKIRVGLNFQADIYFPPDNENIEGFYIRYYTRGNYDWDYAIITNSYIQPYQLKNKIWPPENTIHEIKVENITICAVLERQTKDDMRGINSYKKASYSEAIKLLINALKLDPNNESALVYLSKSYLKINDFHNAEKTIKKCLSLCPDLEQAIQVLGLIYYHQKQYNRAIEQFRKNIIFNNQYAKSFESLGYCFSKQKQDKKAIYYLKKSLAIDSKNIPACRFLIELLNRTGKSEEAEKYKKLFNLN